MNTIRIVDRGSFCINANTNLDLAIHWYAIQAMAVSQLNYLESIRGINADVWYRLVVNNWQHMYQ